MLETWIEIAQPNGRAYILPHSILGFEVEHGQYYIMTSLKKYKVTPKEFNTAQELVRAYNVPRGLPT